MKPFGSITNRTFWNDWFGKIKNIPSTKVRNSEKKKYGENVKTEVQLPIIKSRTTLKNNWKKDEGLC
jgi:hypothetical protein